MQRKLSKNNVYNAGNNSTNQELIHQHMCNHYRRILNAKKAVDTSPPYCYRSRKSIKLNVAPPCGGCNVGSKPLSSRNTSPALTERTNSTNSCRGSRWGTDSYVGTSRYHVACVQDSSPAPVKYTCVDMNLVDRIAYDTKNGPAAYCDEGWMEIKAQRNDKRFRETRETRETKGVANSSSTSKRHLPCKGSNDTQQKRKFTLKINNENSSEIPTSCSTVAPNCKCTKICVCDSNESEYKKPSDNQKEQSQTSSRDSAYNGGVSSLPESRSPTPDQRGKKECCCPTRHYYSQKREKVVRVVNEQEEPPQSPKSLKSVESPRAPRSFLPPTAKACRAEDEKKSMKKMKEDALYVKFIQDITVEVLQKCLYTNKALKKVMRRHMMDNLKTLDKDRMVKEVENLRIQLGIPEDKNLLNLEAEWEDTCSEVINCYPIITDSEFAMPKSKPNTPEATEEKVLKKTQLGEMPSRAKSREEEIPKSLSEIILRNMCEEVLGSNSSDDCDLSVIQVAKVIRERRSGRSLGTTPVAVTPNQGNSEYESDQSSEVRKRHKAGTARKQSARTSYSSSSESEGSGKKCPRSYSEFCEVHAGMSRSRCKNRSCEQLFSFEKCNLKRSSSLILDKKTRNVSFRHKDCFGNRNVELQQKATVTCCKKPSDQQNKPKEY